MLGGSDGMPIVGDFAVKYGSMAAQLGVPFDDLYQALVDTAENTVRPAFFILLNRADERSQPPDWYMGMFCAK